MNDKSCMKALVLWLILACGLSVVGAQASPLLQVRSGGTTVVLTNAMLTKLGDCTIAAIPPAQFVADQGRLIFRITRGAFASDPQDPAGEIDHNGGVSLSCPGLGRDGTVNIQNLTLQWYDTGYDAPVLTGLVTTESADLEPGSHKPSRLKLFKVAGDTLTISAAADNSFVRIRRADLTLTIEAALFLGSLGIGTPDAELVFGRALIKANFLLPPDN